MWLLTSRRFPTRESHATWLFAFLRADFATMTPGQELDWREGAREFADIVGGGVIFERTQGGGLEAADNLPTLKVLRALQDKLRRGLEMGSRGEVWTERVRLISGIIRLDKGYVRQGSRVIWRRFYQRGSFRDLFVAAMQEVILEAGSRISTCPQCHHYFLKSRKQEYCSPNCSQKARWARFTATRPPRNYRRERERALQNRLGPKAKVHLQHRRTGITTQTSKTGTNRS